MRQQSRAIVLLACAMFVGSTMAQMSSIKLWDQCGGKSCPKGECADAVWSETSCAPGLKCFRDSEYYWQCRATAKLWDQCGGKSCRMEGMCKDGVFAACIDGHQCVRQSEFYWQCMPEGATVAPQAAPAPVAVSPQRNMRLSKAQLAHVPIPRHSVVTTSSKKKAASGAASVAAIPAVIAPARITPAEAEHIRPSENTQIRPAAAEQIRPVMAEQIRPAKAEQTRPAAAEQIRPAAVKPTEAEAEEPRVATASMHSRVGPTSAHWGDRIPEPMMRPQQASIAASQPARPSSMPASTASEHRGPIRRSPVDDDVIEVPREEVSIASASKPTAAAATHRFPHNRRMPVEDPSRRD